MLSRFKAPMFFRKKLTKKKQENVDFKNKKPSILNRKHKSTKQIITKD